MTIVDPKFSSDDVSTNRVEQSRFASSQLGGRSKRLFDIAFVLFALPLLIPFALASALAIKLTSGGDILFRQDRIGYRGKKFQCLKFRTMVPDAEQKLAKLMLEDREAFAEYQKTHKLKNDPRILPLIGSFLRKSSLDELPQFINVLRGDMSIVGPRPIMRSEFDEMNKTHARAYMTARPGITGRWQVSGRNELDFSDRAKLDISYIRNWSLLNDLRIIARTVVVLIQAKGAY